MVNEIGIASERLITIIEVQIRFLAYLTNLTSRTFIMNATFWIQDDFNSHSLSMQLLLNMKEYMYSVFL